MVEESAHHLFVDYPFARMCWDILNVDISLNGSFPELSSQIKIKLNTQLLMEAIILMWSTRNELIFRGNSLNLSECRRSHFSGLKLLKHRVKASQQNQFFTWIQSLE
jgi:hypothetical protein